MTLQTTMRAARLHAAGGRFQIDELPVPAVRPTDVLVKVATAGIVQNLRNVIDTYPATRPMLPLPRLPAVFGLDASGTVAAVGDRVRSGISVGDRVYVNPGLSCGACLACRRGEPANCPGYAFMGYFGFGKTSQDQYDAYPYGGFSEYLTAPVSNLVRLPDKVSFEQACRFGYLGTAYAGLCKADMRPGMTVLVNGATGTLGVGAVLLALAMGAARVFATGRDAQRLARLQALAPGRVQPIRLGGAPVATTVLQHTDGLGADLMIEALAPGSPAALVIDAFNALRRGGKAVNVGGVSETLPLEPARLMVQQKSLIGSLWFTTAQAEAMAALAGAGLLDLSPFEHEAYALAAVNEAIDAIAHRSGGFTNILIRHG